jgi:hypothetical protein
MRTLSLALLLALSLPACRKHTPPEEPAVAPVVAAATPEEAAPVVAAPEALPSPARETPVAPPAPAGPERTTPPSSDELKAALKPLFPKIGQCITRATPAPERTQFELFGLRGVPEANECLRDVFEHVSFAPWTGLPQITDLTVQRSGEPVPAPRPDGGAAKK